MSEPSIDIHPEHQTLLEEITRLRNELTLLLTTEHELLHISKPHLLALYQKTIGAWEVSCLQVQIEAARARRKLELAQAAINQGHGPDWPDIEQRLELELLAWQQRLSEATAQLNKARERDRNLLSPEQAGELKHLYYALVKALHPDLHPGVNEDQRRLWQRVQEAYALCDLAELRALLILAERPIPAGAEPAALEKLRQQRDTLLSQIAVMERRLVQLETEPPFPLRALLADDAWVAARRQEIEARTAQFHAHRAALDAALQVLLNAPDDGKQFSSN